MARDHKAPSPLMVTDIEMPGLNGHVLAERLAADRPETKVIYTSGDSDDADPRHDMSGHHAFLEKPFSSDDLVGKVREILDSPKRLVA